MPDPVGGAGEAAHGASHFLQRRVGPLPLWGWAIAIGGAGLAVRLVTRRPTTGASALPVIASGPPGASGGGGARDHFAYPPGTRGATSLEVLEPIAETVVPFTAPEAAATRAAPVTRAAPAPEASAVIGPPTRDVATTPPTAVREPRLVEAGAGRHPASMTERALSAFLGARAPLAGEPDPVAARLGITNEELNEIRSREQYNAYQRSIGGQELPSLMPAAA